jgi:hypothetical protein
MSKAPKIYRGSLKHKNRPEHGPKGTLCPEWTHTTPAGGFASDVFTHDWTATHAAALFRCAVYHTLNGHYYATARGVAFEAKATNDGTWHGYPIDWVTVPPDIKRAWLATAKVSGRQVKQFFRFEKDDIHRALRTDTR